MNRRSFLKTLGAFAAALVLPVKWVGERIVQQRKWTGGPILVAAANASTEAQRNAHFVARGYSDQETINAALSLVGSGGLVLTEGDYYLSDSIKGLAGSMLNGQNRTTYFRSR